MGSQIGAQEAECCRFCGIKLSTGRNHIELCSNLRRHGLLRSDRAFDAFMAVDRMDFVPEVQLAYIDGALPLGEGSQISAPHVHACAMDLLCERLETRLASDSTPIRVLDIGSGSGYMCAVFARALEGIGSVLGVEHIEELATQAQQNVAQRHGDMRLEIVCEDAQQFAEHFEAETFDLVHCGAALPEVPPWLIRLLKPDGRAVLPLGLADTPQWLSCADKAVSGEVTVVKHIVVLYVPVISASAQRERGQNWDDVVERCITNAEDHFLYDA